MKTQKYEITINATKEKVWEVLWTDETYRKWTSAFSEISSAESDWEEGSRIIFGDGKGKRAAGGADSRPLPAHDRR